MESNNKPKVLDLFSGIGGFSLGLENAGMETAAFCEIDEFCQKVLRKNWPEKPIATDITQLKYEEGKLYENDEIIYEGKIDIVCGGFPCQPFSVAGTKQGAQDDRDLWPQMFRLIQECKPSWVIGENVANFTNMAFTRTKTNLESQGYEVQPFIIPACAVGAPHRRDRVWIVAYNAGFGSRLRLDSSEGNNLPSAQSSQNDKVSQSKKAMAIENIGDGKDLELSRLWQEIISAEDFASDFILEDGMRVESTVRRNSNGVSSRLDEDLRQARIKALGNAIVPQIVQIMGNIVTSLEAQQANSG